MKVLVCGLILFLLAFAPVARAEGPDDQYVRIFNTLQQADGFNEKGELPAAMAKYVEAESALKRFQTANPGWNPKIIAYRLDYIAGKITAISVKAPSIPIARDTTSTNAPPTVATTVATTVPPAPPTNSIPSSGAETPPQPVAVVTPPVQPTVVVPPPPPVPSDAENQIQALQEHIRHVEADKVLLEAKLREALSAQPAAIDPRELAKAQEQIMGLQKENELLKVSLSQAKAVNAPAAGTAASDETKNALAEANLKLAQLADANTSLTREKEALQARVKSPPAPDPALLALREENEILKKQVAGFKTGKPAAAPSNSDLNRKLIEAQAQLAVLQSDKEVLRLEKTALENRVKQMSASGGQLVATAAPVPIDAAGAERIRQLEAQRDDLQKKLSVATDEIAARKKNAAPARVDEMGRQLASLRSRIEVLEATRVPYTAEELAMISKPEPAMLAATVHSPPRKTSPTPTAAPSADATALLTEARHLLVANQFEKAEEKFLEAVKLDDKNSAALATLASLQIELGHIADADTHITAALALDPNNDNSLFVLGRVRFEELKYDDALEAFSRAAELNPKNAEVQNYLGITLSEKGLRGPAETALRKAIQIDPQNANAHANLAFIYATQQPPLLELAKWHYDRAIAAGHSRNPKLEKVLNPSKPPDNGH